MLTGKMFSMFTLFLANRALTVLSFDFCDRLKMDCESLILNQ